MASSRVRSKSKEIVYPESDGKPLGETGWHVTATLEFLADLKLYYEGRRDVYVASNMFLYFVEGDPTKVVCPDCMVIFGVDGNHERATFKTWVEHVVPAFVLEVSSKKTIRNDLGKKKAIYADLGVRDYFLYDPLGDCLDVPLLGFRLDNRGVYQPIPVSPEGGLLSEAIGFEIVPEGRELRLIDPHTRTRRPFVREYRALASNATHAAEREREIAERERRRADEYAREVERLKKLLAEGRGEPDQQS